MMPHEPVLDIMRRTMVNLRYVEHQATKSGPYELTQLINSFLGALAHPWEQYRTELNAMALASAVELSWPELRKEHESDKDPTSLGHLLQLLRNGIAHGNLTFLPDGKGQIAALKIISKDRKGNRTWGTIITPEAMRTLLRRFVDLIENTAASGAGDTNRAA